MDERLLTTALVKIAGLRPEIWTRELQIMK
jgi:hypothetical protein